MEKTVYVISNSEIEAFHDKNTEYDKLEDAQLDLKLMQGQTPSEYLMGLSVFSKTCSIKKVL